MSLHGGQKTPPERRRRRGKDLHRRLLPIIPFSISTKYFLVLDHHLSLCLTERFLSSSIQVWILRFMLTSNCSEIWCQNESRNFASTTNMDRIFWQESIYLLLVRSWNCVCCPTMGACSLPCFYYIVLRNMHWQQQSSSNWLSWVLLHFYSLDSWLRTNVRIWWISFRIFFMSYLLDSWFSLNWLNVSDMMSGRIVLLLLSVLGISWTAHGRHSATLYKSGTPLKLISFLYCCSCNW